jgi:elongation of very long chain fatty acids protein 4
MCGPTQEKQLKSEALLTPDRKGSSKVTTAFHQQKSAHGEKSPNGVTPKPPTLVARYACAGIMVSVFAVWGVICWTPDSALAPVGDGIHDWTVPTALTFGYLLALPLLRVFSKQFLSESLDVKLLLKETMVVYNGGQVVLNCWMVFKILQGLCSRDHPFIGDVYTITPGLSHALWIHYVDKYLEFFDTVFMVLRGRMDQVRRW